MLSISGGSSPLYCKAGAVQACSKATTSSAGLLAYAMYARRRRSISTMKISAVQERTSNPMTRQPPSCAGASAPIWSESSAASFAPSARSSAIAMIHRPSVFQTTRPRRRTSWQPMCRRRDQVRARPMPGSLTAAPRSIFLGAASHCCAFPVRPIHRGCATRRQRAVSRSRRSRSTSPRWRPSTSEDFPSFGRTDTWPGGTTRCRRILADHRSDQRHGLVYSSEILAALMIGSHFSSSSLMKAAASAGVPPAASISCLPMRSLPLALCK